MNYSYIIKSRRKFFLSGVFALIACISLNAAGLRESRIIFEGGNDVINGKEHLFIKQYIHQTIAKNGSETKRTIEAVKNDIAEKESPEIVIPDFPFDPSSLSYSYNSTESAIPVSQQRLHEYQAACKVTRENTFTEIKNSDLSIYLPEQRQKFSTAATQCGILTSFSPNSPSL